MKNNKRAFTLIELLVVVLIIGILAAIAVPQYQKAVYKSRATEAMLMLKSLHQAQELYYTSNGEYTTNLSALDITIPNTSQDSNKYYYYCISGRQALCEAKVNNDNMPSFEYTMEYRPAGLPNRFWCRVANSEGKNSIAKEICRTLGKESTLVDASWFNGQYFELN